MPQNPQHQGSFSFLDASEERSTMTFQVGPITDLTLPGFLTQFGSFRAATEAISGGALVQDSWTGDVTKYDNDAPADISFQRERKFVFFFQGTTTFSKYRIEVPVADFSTDRLLPGTDIVDLTQTEIAAWVTAFEALCKTEDGEDVEVLSGKGVGRNI